jgi:signal transduction histidine kinase
MSYNGLEKSRKLLPFLKLETGWEFIRLGLSWSSLAMTTFLVYVAFYNLVDGFLPVWFEQSNHTLTVVFATLLTLFLFRPLKTGCQSLVDHLFFSDTAHLKDEVEAANRTLATIHDLETLRQFLIKKLPAQLRVDGIYLHQHPQSLLRHSLTLPLNMGNRSLGYVTIGPRYSGRSFSYEERSSLKQLQEQISLVLSGIQLAEAREEAEQVDQLKSNFLRNISHELKTPLNTVINSTGLVADGILGPVDEELAASLNQAVQGSEYLMQLLDDILDIAKIESGQLTLRLDEMDLKEVVEDALIIIKASLQQKPIELKLDIAADLPTLVADRLRIRQVLLNLLSNAVKFTKTGWILIKARRERNLILVTVADSGIGIAPTDLRLIFEDYQQVSAGQHRELKLERRRHLGTGLGMPITKALVELHGGQIWVESEPGQGSAFTFTLPINPKS